MEEQQIIAQPTKAASAPQQLTMFALRELWYQALLPEDQTPPLNGNGIVTV
jgi:hypothetical protein